MQLIGNLIPAVNFILLGFIHDRNWALFIMIIAVSSSGAAYPGYSANCLDICPKYTGILYSVSNTLATIPGIVAPILAGAIVGMPPTFLQWQIVFSIAAGLYIIGNIFYVKYARGDVVEELNREIL
jgi:MFS family permease